MFDFKTKEDHSGAQQVLSCLSVRMANCQMAGEHLYTSAGKQAAGHPRLDDNCTALVGGGILLASGHWPTPAHEAPLADATYETAALVSFHFH